MKTFQDAVTVMEKSRPSEMLHRLTSGDDVEFADAEEVVTFQLHPRNTLYVMGYEYREEDDPSLSFSAVMEGKDPGEHTKIKTIMCKCSAFSPAVGTWNANGEARWQQVDGRWLIVEAELLQEQCFEDEDKVQVIFAFWRVEEGLAAAVWRVGDRELLAEIMGLGAWPATGWQHEDTLWFGE